MHKGLFLTTTRNHCLHAPPRPPPSFPIEDNREVCQLLCQQTSELLNQTASKIIGQLCINLDDSQNKGEYPDFQMVGVNALLQ
jgi:hypothetical protein